MTYKSAAYILCAFFISSSCPESYLISLKLAAKESLTLDSEASFNFTFAGSSSVDISGFNPVSLIEWLQAIEVMVEINNPKVMYEWSLEKEICSLAGESDFREALYKLGVLESSDTEYTIERDKEWIREGSEIYTYRFRVVEKNGGQSGYIIKACVGFSPYSNLENIFNNWISRRTLISNNNISTPLLVTYGKGVLIEELIPHQFKDVLIGSDNRMKLLEELATWAGVLSRLGFAPLVPFDDLRSRGNDLVVIDFGEDLGSPGIVKPRNSDIYERTLKDLKKWGISLDEEMHMHLYHTFKSSRDTSLTNTRRKQ